jgi:hypothetical protein
VGEVGADADYGGAAAFAVRLPTAVGVFLAHLPRSVDCQQPPRRGRLGRSNSPFLFLFLFLLLLCFLFFLCFLFLCLVPWCYVGAQPQFRVGTKQVVPHAAQGPAVQLGPATARRPGWQTR